MLQLVRIMQIDPRLGILQSLVIGMPSASAFARIFQFGMRLGMRSYTLGSAWWQGDCGPYWGHNAIVRIAPFMAHCRLPMLAGNALVSGHVLSHDQIEAVLMRRAGYEVRVLAEEGSSFEQNPPTLRRVHPPRPALVPGQHAVLAFPAPARLRPVSRYQLAFAILMFIGSPAWIGMLLIGSLARRAWRRRRPTSCAPMPASRCCSLVLAMWFAPNIATVIDVLPRAGSAPRLRRRRALRRELRSPIVFVILLRRSCGRATRCSWCGC